MKNQLVALLAFFTATADTDDAHFYAGIVGIAPGAGCKLNGQLF
jgi:hypothetical protein